MLQQEKIVIKIMDNLVTHFKTNWEEEKRRQKSIAKRAREILLRWGEFSEQYVEKAKFLVDDEDEPDVWIRFLGIVVLAPMIAVLPFIFEIVNDPSENMWLTSLWHSMNAMLIGGLSLLFPYINEYVSHLFSSYLSSASYSSPNQVRQDSVRISQRNTCNVLLLSRCHRNCFTSDRISSLNHAR